MPTTSRLIIPVHTTVWLLLCAASARADYLKQAEADLRAAREGSLSQTKATIVYNRLVLTKMSRTGRFEEAAAARQQVLHDIDRVVRSYEGAADRARQERANVDNHIRLAPRDLYGEWLIDKRYMPRRDLWERREAEATAQARFFKLVAGAVTVEGIRVDAARARGNGRRNKADALRRQGRNAQRKLERKARRWGLTGSGWESPKGVSARGVNVRRGRGTGRIGRRL